MGENRWNIQGFSCFQKWLRLPGTGAASPTPPPAGNQQGTTIPYPSPRGLERASDCHWRCGCHSARTQGNGRPPISDAVLRHPGPRRAGTAHPTPPRTWGIAGFSPDNSLSWHGISMRPEGPWLPDSPKKQCKAWRCPGRNRSPNGSVWRVPLFVLLCKSRRVHAPLGRCSAGKARRCSLLPRPCGWRAGGEKDKQGKSGQDRGRETGGGNLQDCPECRSADSDAGQGGRINIENHENRSADMERGRKADVQSGRGCLGSGKQAKIPMFSVIPRASCRPLRGPLPRRK